MSPDPTSVLPAIMGSSFPAGNVPIASGQLADGETIASPTVVPSPGTSSSDWKLCKQFNDRVVYQGRHSATRLDACRVVLAAAQFDRSSLKDLARRCRLIGLLDVDGALDVIEQQLDADPPVIVAAMPGEWQPLETATINSSQRLKLAAELVDLIRRAHRVGLFHGRLSASRVYLLQEAPGCYSVRLDFLGLLESEPLVIEPTVDADLIGLADVLRTLLMPAIEDGTTLRGRQRAALKNRLDPDIEDPVSLQLWLETLQPWLPEDPSVTFAGGPSTIPKHDTSDDRTNVLSLPDAGADAVDDKTDPGVRPSLTTHSIIFEPGDVLGRFEIQSHIGEGGMGSVYKAVDLGDQCDVAVKVLRTQNIDVVKAIRRFQKEARMLGEVENDYVTRLLHVGEDHGVHFMAMEFVDGVNLKQWLDGKLPLEETAAISIVADVTRALVDAHEKTIVHRDIKPDNVLVQSLDPSHAASGTSVLDLSKVRIKLTDFGIARHVRQSVSMEVTRAGCMLGTPRYMSPEQCKGDQEVTPAADIYALGVMLFELLTGEPPFQSDDPMRLAGMHCFDPAPTARSRGVTCSDATERILARALTKDPGKRFLDAEDLLENLERILHGEPCDFEAHPRMPDHTRGKVWQKTKTWQLTSRPEEVWPFVSNTERLNRAIGLPPVQYETQHDPDLGLRKWGSFRLGGVSIRWEEHPFEWIEGQRMGILREFETGPFRWLLSIVTLEPSGNGTRLSHEVRIEPRNLMGRALTKIEADWKGFRNLDRVYRRIDRSIQGTLASHEGTDAFEPAPKQRPSLASRLQQRSEQMIEAGTDPLIAAKLVDFLTTSPPQPLSQIRPIELADRLNIGAESMLDTCLLAAAHGLLELRWEVICPTCRVSAESFDLLSDIRSHTRCDACNVQFQSNAAEQIELVFRAHPEIRTVDDANYCIGGPEHAPHVVAQVRIDASERMELELSLGVGDYLLRSTRLPRTQAFRIVSGGAPGRLELALNQFGTTTFVPTLRAGRQRILLRNDETSLHVVKVERSIDRSRCVTAAAAMAMPRFRKLFPTQTFAVDNPIATRQVTLLTAAITNLDELYQTLGDSDAYRLVQSVLQVSTDVVHGLGGSVVKTSAEHSVAVFRQCNDAVCAALELDRQLHARAEFSALHTGIGVHRGDALVATQNGSSDYFGVHVRAAGSLPSLANGGVLLTESVYADPVVAASFQSQLRSAPVTEIDLPGLPLSRVQFLSSREANHG